MYNKFNKIKTEDLVARFLLEKVKLENLNDYVRNLSSMMDIVANILGLEEKYGNKSLYKTITRDELLRAQVEIYEELKKTDLIFHEIINSQKDLAFLFYIANGFDFDIDSFNEVIGEGVEYLYEDDEPFHLFDEYGFEDDCCNGSLLEDMKIDLYEDDCCNGSLLEDMKIDLYEDPWEKVYEDEEQQARFFEK